MQKFGHILNPLKIRVFVGRREPKDLHRFYFTSSVFLHLYVFITSHSVIDLVCLAQSQNPFLRLFISPYDLLWPQSVAISVPNKSMIERGEPNNAAEMWSH